MLRAASQQDDALLALALRRSRAGAGIDSGFSERLLGRQIEHGAEFLEAKLGEQSAERLGERHKLQRHAETVWVGQHGGQQRSHGAIFNRAPARFIDVRARMIHQMHVVDATGAGGHARQAREAAVNVMFDFRAGPDAALEHVFDQINAAARTVALVAKQHIGGACRRTQAAMDAGAQDLIDLGDAWLLALLGGKVGLHGGANLKRHVHAAGIENI